MGGIDERGSIGMIDMFGFGWPYTIPPMAADVCQVRLGTTADSDAPTSPPELWATAVRVESKRTKPQSRVLSLCSPPIVQGEEVKRCPSPFFEGENTPGMACRSF